MEEIDEKSLQEPDGRRRKVPEGKSLQEPDGRRRK
jgi:hypothetical protein